MTLGGQTAVAPALLDRLLEETRSRPRGEPRSAALRPIRAWSLPDAVDPAWQLRFADSVEAGMTPAGADPVGIQLAAASPCRP